MTWKIHWNDIKLVPKAKSRGSLSSFFVNKIRGSQLVNTSFYFSLLVARKQTDREPLRLIADDILGGERESTGRTGREPIHHDRRLQGSIRSESKTSRVSGLVVSSSADPVYINRFATDCRTRRWPSSSYRGTKWRFRGRCCSS